MNNKGIFSLLITVVIALLFGIVGLLQGGSFFSWFIMAIVIQFLSFFLWNSTIDVIARLQYRKMEADLEAVNIQNSITLPCSKCNHPNTVLIDINSADNEFTCTECGVENSIYVSVVNAQKTNILYKKDVLTQDDIHGLEDAEKIEGK